MASCLIETQKDFVLEAYGSNKTDAFGKAFGKLKNTAYQSLQNQGLILHMEPVDVEILEEHEQSMTEKIVGFFKPKPIMHYQVKFRVTVRIKYIPL